MKSIVLALCIGLFSVLAQAQAPSTASIDRLLAVMGTQKMVDSMYGQLDRALRSALEQGLANNPRVTPADRERAARSVDGFVKRMLAIYSEEISWPKLRALYTKVYAETFTQAEVDGLIAFYESPVGKSFVAKMPAVTQKTMVEMQQRMQPLMQRIQAASRDFAREYESQGAGSPAPMR